MAAHAPAGERVLRLNPFAFPSDTSFRFVLLIVFVIGSSLICYLSLWAVLHRSQSLAYTTAFSESLRHCSSNPANKFSTSSECIQNLLQAQQPYNRGMAIWEVGGVAATLTLAAAFYWITPAWIIRRNRFQPLNIPEVIGYLQQLRCEVDLSCDPSFLWDPLNRARSAVAFGRLGRYYVGLSGGLVAQFYTDRPAFRAVVLHEFAHLYNADVNKTCFTVALWQAFLVTPIVPTGASLLWHWKSLRWEDVDFIVSICLVPIALVLLTRNAVLRIREFYADLRASVWEGSSDSLARVLETLPASKVGRWRAWLQVHPDPGERFQTLKNTHRLFRLGFWEAFGAGFAAALAISSIHGLLTPLWPELPQQLAHYTAVLWVGPFLLSLSLAVGAVGIGVWRGEFIALMQGQVSREAGRLGLALALGMILQWVLFLATLIKPSLSDHSLTLSLSLLLVPGITLLFASAFLILRWMAAAASVWLEVALRNRSPRLPLMLSLAVGSGSLILLVSASLLSLAYVLYSVSHPEWRLEITNWKVLFFSFVILPGTLILMSVVGLLAFPLAAWF